MPGNEKKLKELAEQCVKDAEKSLGKQPKSCKAFFEEFLWLHADISSDGKIWNEDWKEYTDIGHMPCTWRSKMIKKALKYLFPDTKFSVRCDQYSLGNSIDISWEDGPPSKVLRNTGVTWQFEKVYRDELTGEILSGGNAFVFDRRRYSPEAREYVKRKVAERFGIPEEEVEREPIYRQEFWKTLEATDFRSEPPRILEEII